MAMIEIAGNQKPVDPFVIPGFLFNILLINFTQARAPSKRWHEHNARASQIGQIGMNNSSGFSLRTWSAWADGLTSHSAWLDWMRAPAPLANAGQPEVRMMPPMLRRRAQRFGRMALETLFSTGDAQAPILFCSRHGEVGRSVELLTELAELSSVSPQSFSMSVHNATAGLFTIAQKTQVMTSALSAGSGTVFSGLCEALSLLNDDVPSVRLLFCDEPLPALYLPWQEKNDAPFACLLEITPGNDFFLDYREPPEEEKTDPAWPEALTLLRFLLGEHGHSLGFDDAAAGWRLLRMASCKA